MCERLSLVSFERRNGFYIKFTGYLIWRNGKSKIWIQIEMKGIENYMKLISIIEYLNFNNKLKFSRSFLLQ